MTSKWPLGLFFTEIILNCIMKNAPNSFKSSIIIKTTQSSFSSSIWNQKHYIL